MKYLLVLFLVVSSLIMRSRLESNVVFAQKPNLLQVIKAYPVKIDGGASFFTYDSINLNAKKYVLVISKEKQAFIQTSGGLIYFTRKKRETTEDGYRDTYSNKSSTLILNIDKIKKTSEYSSVRSGTLELEGATRFLMKVHGKVDEFDKYNYPERLK